jgi:hypothetical protein
MRSLFYGILLTLPFAFAGNVHAASELNGKAVFCKSNITQFRLSHPVWGLTFVGGKVIRHEVNGFSIIRKLGSPYTLSGTTTVTWSSGYLDRSTLKTKDGNCSVSSYREITQKLNEIIANAKKKNKI